MDRPKRPRKGASENEWDAYRAAMQMYNRIHGGGKHGGGGAQRSRQRRGARPSAAGGTAPTTAFSDKEKRDGSGKRDILFNGPGDGDMHGHVAQHDDGEGGTAYNYVRDVDGDVYIDDSRED